MVSGIHRIDGIRQANSYLVICKDTMLIIDTGMPGSSTKITDFVRNLNKNLVNPFSKGRT